RKPTAEQISQSSDLEDPRSGISRIWDEEHDRHVLRSLLDRVRPDFDARIWGIFERIVFEGCSAREIARDLGCTTNVVFIAKARVLKRLRLEDRGTLRIESGRDLERFPALLRYLIKPLVINFEANRIRSHRRMGSSALSMRALLGRSPI